MGYRKVYVKLEVRLIILQDESVETAEIVNELSYGFRDRTGQAEVATSEITDWEVTDSK